MSDVKELFGRLLEEPAPALPDTGQVLGMVRRARARRRLAVGAALAVATGLVAGLGGLVSSRQAPQAPIGATTAASPRADLVGEPELRRMQATLRTVLPPGVRLLGTAGETSRSDGPRGPLDIVGVFADLLVAVPDRPSQGGQLLAYVLAGPAGAATGDLCAIPLDARVLTGSELACAVETVAGHEVRVGRLRQPAGISRVPSGHVDVDYAVRYVDGWLIVVWELPYTNEPINDPRSSEAVALLAEPVYTGRRLAELTLEPGFRPPAG